MNKIFKIKSWEIFTILFVIPCLILFNIHFIFKNFGLSILFYLIWVLLISWWLYKLSMFCKSDYLEKFEIKLFTLSLILINLIHMIIGLFMWFSINENISNKGYFSKLLSQNINFIKSCIVLSFFTVLIIASRFLTAKKLQKSLTIQDYIKSFVLFLCLPIGIFWIQNEINAFSEKEPDNKTRTKVLIGTIISLIIVTIFTIYSQDLKFSYGNKNQTNIERDSLMNARANQDFEDYYNSMDDSTKAEFLFKGALELYQMGHFRNAIENISYAISLDSTVADFYLHRGMFLSEQYNQFDSAILDMSKTIVLNPNDWKAYYYRASFNYTLDKLDKVLPDLQKLMEQEDDNPDAYLLRGMLKTKLKDTEGACLDFKKAYSLGNEEAHRKLRELCNVDY